MANITGFAGWDDYGGTGGMDLTDGFVGRGVDKAIAILRDTRKPAFSLFSTFSIRTTHTSHAETISARRQ
jgi:hypothetical protein